jgi:competence protein ComFC
VGCGIEGSVICQECGEKIDSLPSVCFMCGKATHNHKPCIDCVGKYKPEHVWMYCEYNGLAKELVLALKFDQKRQAACEIAKFIDEILPYFNTQPLLTFVPTSPNRIRGRGFDHAKLIAKELAMIRGWHYQTLLSRQKEAHQLGSTREQRLNQLRGVFGAISEISINNKHILLVDDVCTTGSTLEECTKQLKKAGARQVDAAVFARTPKNG